VPESLQAVLVVWDRGGLWLMILLTLLPLAMTMALIWKTKEVILESVFGGHH
jgi:heme/copper-type cytochrome/quinol oxidase subunit 4